MYLLPEVSTDYDLFTFLLCSIFQSLHNGLTGGIEFDNHGLRSNITVDIMDLRWDGLNRIGNWKSEGNYRVNLTKVEAPLNDNDKDYGPISNKTFRVIIAIVNI